MAGSVAIGGWRHRRTCSLRHTCTSWSSEVLSLKVLLMLLLLLLRRRERGRACRGWSRAILAAGCGRCWVARGSGSRSSSSSTSRASLLLRRVLRSRSCICYSKGFRIGTRKGKSCCLCGRAANLAASIRPMQLFPYTGPEPSIEVPAAEEGEQKRPFEARWRVCVGVVC
jgi:hypothetical protein